MRKVSSGNVASFEDLKTEELIAENLLLLLELIRPVRIRWWTTRHFDFRLVIR